jgi:hypothetical protein
VNNNVAKSKRKAAIRHTKQQHSSTIAGRYYLTLNKRKCSCGVCGGVQQAGATVVYRHSPRLVLCQPCAEFCGVDARPSLRWESARLKT